MALTVVASSSADVEAAAAQIATTVQATGMVLAGLRWCTHKVTIGTSRPFQPVSNEIMTMGAGFGPASVPGYGN